MFCSNEHNMSISHMAIFVYMATQQYGTNTIGKGMNPIILYPAMGK